ncbi:MAG: hypothetical protein J7497_12825 [Chitinophagaceae bacterium]|nr:hypothetical protein [Chitinophagaceae bacterium]
MIRKWIVLCWLILIFSGISLLFWHNEWKYSLPTPVPHNYQPVNPGTPISIGNVFKQRDPSKPVLLHFFNPDCPCSRFNITHFKSLVKQYGDKIDFVIIAMPGKDKNYTALDIQDRFRLSLPVLFDSSIAATCGVYSTPQAVLIGADHRLYYRGNYNKSRYCTDKKSNYAQMAIDSLLLKSAGPSFGEAAVKSYGCELPLCTK